MIKNPRLLTELLSVNFSDLVAVFKDIIEEVIDDRSSDLVTGHSDQGDQMTSLEEAYVRLFRIIEKRGAAGVVDLAPKTTSDHVTSSDHSDAKVMKIVDKHLQRLASDHQELLTKSDSKLEEFHSKLKKFDILRNEKRVAALLDLMEDKLVTDWDNDELSSEEEKKDEL